MELKRFHLGQERAISSMIRSTLFTVNAGDYPEAELEAIAQSYGPGQVAELAERASLFALWAEDGETCLACGAVGPMAEQPGDAEGDTVFCLSALFVAAEVTGLGYGRRMMEGLEGYARKLGGRCVRLQASITGRGFYEALDYRHLRHPPMPNAQGVHPMEKLLPAKGSG